MVDCFQRLSEDSSCRVVLLTGEGKNFTSGHLIYLLSRMAKMCLPVPVTGLDLVDFAPMFSQFQATGNGDIARRASLVHHLVRPMQESFTAIEKV